MTSILNVDVHVLRTGLLTVKGCLQGIYDRGDGKAVTKEVVLEAVGEALKGIDNTLVELKEEEKKGGANS